ncbi:MAG: hypothetical protein AB7S39_16915 [Gemmatimonadales bacterium]
MILIALALMASLALAAGLGGPVAAGELATGRRAFDAVAVRWAATGALNDLARGMWIDSALSRLPGESVSLGVDSSAVLVVRRSAHNLGSGVWLAEVSAGRIDRAGRERAAVRLGGLVQVAVFAGDSVERIQPLSRFPVRGFQ